MKSHFVLIITSLLLLTGNNLLAQKGNILKVEKSTFIFSVVTPKPLFKDAKEGQFTIRDYYQFTDVSKPGTYKLPSENLILAIPPESRPNFKIVEKSEAAISSVLPAINPRVIIQNDSSTVLKSIGYDQVKNISYIKPVIEVLGYFWYRDFYCAYLRINTFSYNYSLNKITGINELKIEADFNNVYNFKTSDPIVIRSKFDYDLSKIIYDSDIAEQFRNKPAYVSSDSASAWINYNTTYIKLAVGKDGIYRITKNYLEQNGINTSSIDPATFQLFNYGKEVPIYVSGENDGSFDQNDFIEFWGARNYPLISYRVINSPDQEYNEYLNRYTDTSCYFLTWGIKKGERVTEENLNTILPADTLNFYTEVDHYESNTMYQNQSDNEVANQTPNWYGNKTWYWQWLLVQSKDYGFSVSNLVPNKEARFYMKLVSGGSNAALRSHNLALKYNNTTLDSEIINRFNQVVLSGKINSGLLTNGNDELTFTNYNNGTSPNYLALDWYDIEYPRQLNLINDSLLFNFRDSSSLGPKTIKINNVPSAGYSLYRTSPGLKKIVNFNIVDSTIYFEDTVFYNGQYCIAGPAKILSPTFIYEKRFTNMADTPVQADYIAITHPKFLNAASNYVSQISSMFNLSTKLINVDDIYDLYGFGYPTPESIKLFIMDAMQNWKEPKPSYFTLIGDADYDYKGYLLKNNGVRVGENYVPSYGDPVGDDWYVIFNDNIPIPQLKLGRIPVNEPSELNYYLSKVEENKSQPYSGWNKRYLFFSGGIQSSDYQQFKAVNDNVISKVISPRPIAGDYSHFYKTQTPQTDFGPFTNQQLQTAIDNGGVFISYIGHSGTATWDNSINNVSQLQNTVDRFPLITDFGCSTNKFAEPDIVCFGERFLLDNDGQAIGYIGNSSLGFVSTATAVPLEFYESLASDSLREVGNAHTMAKSKLFTYFGNSAVNKVFAYTNVLLGDPAVRLKIPDEPNLLVNGNSFIFPRSAVTESDDSIEVGIIIENDGLAPADSVMMNIKHQLSGGKIIEQYNLNAILPEFKDTLFIRLRTKGMPGQHVLIVYIDPENKIEEIYKNDNTYSYSFNVYSSSLRDMIENVVENPKIDTLLILNPAESSTKDFNIKLQLSGNSSFIAPQEYTFAADSFYTAFKFLPLQPAQRYWYRYKIDSSSFEYGSPKSFFNSAGGKYLLNDSVSFANQDLTKLKINSSGISLGNDSVKISVLSAGFNAGATCVIAKDGINLLSNSYFAGMGIVVFDPLTMAVDTSVWFSLFNQPANVQALANLINSIPNGKIVAMGVSDDAANNISGALISAIKSLGSTKIDSLRFRGSWALIGKKGAAPGEVVEQVKGTYDGSVLIDSTFIIRNFTGEMLTGEIGPAVKWNSITTSSVVPAGSRISYKLLGVKADESVDTLGNINLTDSTASLSQIKAGVYPKIKLSADFESDPGGSSPQLQKLSVDYLQPAELGLNYQTVSILPDTVYQGNTTRLNFTIFNTGQAEADSFKVNVLLTNQEKSQSLLLDTLITKLNSLDKIPITLNYKSNYNDGYGNLSFSISVDPQNKISELYKDNNFYTEQFFVIKDTVTYVKTASMDVTFDGNTIYNGDYVSPKPWISFILHYGALYPYSDTTSLSFLLDGQKIYFAQMDSIVYDTINRQVRYNVKPVLKDGEHYLSVTGGNLVNQPQELQKYFYVSSELKVLNLFNYPNPFKFYTYFTFNLTQIPDEMKINIYTVAGRLIKVINVPVDQLRNNFNKIYWDGRDEDGSIIANGVYLYKVITKLSGKTFSDIQKLAVIR